MSFKDFKIRVFLTFFMELQIIERIGRDSNNVPLVAPVGKYPEGA